LRLSENRLLEKILGSEREQVEGVQRKLHDGNLRVLYSPSNIMVIKLWGTRWMGHMADVGRTERKSFVGKI
jgi:hypothetical protein